MSERGLHSRPEAPDSKFYEKIDPLPFTTMGAFISSEYRALLAQLSQSFGNSELDRVLILLKFER